MGGIGVTEGWKFRQAVPGDAEWLADLKAAAMRPDLERLGYWDASWARARFLTSFVPANTQVIVHDGVDAGCIAIRTEPDAWWLEHFYLASSVQGHGVGGSVLAATLARCGPDRPIRLSMNRGSRVRPLYERHGFRHVDNDPNGVDLIFERDTTESRS
ncbi:GNAT family N-acetyltransferase [Amycolatopsis sp. PS_44_ISF1]|uniref:GNAT family N-acetyltransferase n=1 Tax=Amycolatopsis sp. PS_44_ISF1 TaxID=2974917 RepID=UPI0028DE61A9|nr:GNAT family N-acetyltransferase [Amycolatopsis sp. PS_44_ISF1]MDT8912937.1 GNAT family N-acetyltransferase [Amycolatopsis sp. PS_44_ISF1]